MDTANNSLVTPFGPLSSFNTEDFGELKDILVRSDKSRMLEGILIEIVFSGIISRLQDQNVGIVPVSIVKAFRRKQNGRAVTSWWVLSEKELLASSAVKDVSGLLESKNDYILPCHYDAKARDFIISSGPWVNKSVQQFLNGKNAVLEHSSFRLPTQAVIDQARSDSAIASVNDSMFGSVSRFYKDVALPRFFKNFALQPFFHGLWDIDSIIQMPDGSFIQLEVKHKYPTQNLEFGINTGQINVMMDLARAGIKTMHIVLVKPVWDKHFRAGYLLSRMDLRSNVMVIGKLMGYSELQELRNRQDYATGREQSLDGRTNQKSKYLKASEFQVLGTLDDQISTIASNIRLTIEGSLANPVTDQLLQEARVKYKAD